MTVSVTVEPIAAGQHRIKGILRLLFCFGLNGTPRRMLLRTMTHHFSQPLLDTDAYRYMTQQVAFHRSCAM